MAETWEQPAYVSLARTSAGILAAPHDDTVRAILAQWQCEQPSPAPWPPVHNNPGNLTRAIGTLDSTPHTLAPSPPGQGLLYAYGSPWAGASAYAHYLLNSRRYPAAVAAARAGDGRGFLIAVDKGGYGTQLRCMLDRYAIAHLAPPPPLQDRWEVLADRTRVRSGPGIRYPIVDHLAKGQIVVGTEVSGDGYPSGGTTRYGWVRIGSARYFAHVYAVRLT